MRPTAYLGLGGFVLLLGIGYGVWTSHGDAPQPAGMPEAPPPAPRPEAARPAAPAPAPEAAAPAPAVAAVQAATAPAAAPAAAASQAPRFDVVRVGARGSAVIAGRAAPGAEVLLIVDGGRELGRARADGRGEWVILPAELLPAGAWELSLRARLAGQETSGPDAVVVVVPEAAPAQVARQAPAAGSPAAAEPAPAEAAPGPIAVLIPPSAAATPPRILQGPQAAGQPRPGAPRLGMDSVDYEEGGSIRFAGSAPPGAAVRIYVGERHAGDAVADSAGRWVLAPDQQPPVGRNALRVDQIAASGTVAARIEVPFQRDALPNDALEAGRVIVQPGTNLWRIARATYGRGTHFTVIYHANREHIRDPHRIFPGQIFALPDNQPASAIR